MKDAKWLPVCIQRLCFRLLITSSVEELVTTSGPESTVTRLKTDYEKNMVSEVTESASLHASDSHLQVQLPYDHSEVDAEIVDRKISNVDDDSEMKEDQLMQNDINGCEY